jgi:hypothetical protein
MNAVQVRTIIGQLTPLEQRGKEIIAFLKGYLQKTFPEISIIESNPSSLRLSFFGAILLVCVELNIGHPRGLIGSSWMYPKELNAKDSEPKSEKIQAYAFDAIGNVFLGPEREAHAETLEEAVPQFISSLVKFLEDKSIALTPQ